MDIGVLHGWPIGAAALISAGVGFLLARCAPWWLADDGHTAVLARSRLFRPLPLALVGVLIAVVAMLFFPHVGPASGTGSTAGASSPSGTGPAPDVGPVAAGAIADMGTGDLFLLALNLGTAAAATPFLFVVDLSVHRLPDRIVYPLLGLELLVFILGLILGESAIWGLGLVAGSAGALFFGVLYLAGRVMRARTMGLGDVKLAFVVFAVPALFSPWAPALVFIIMMGLAGLAALLIAAARRSLQGSTIAFGPAMLSGMWFGSVLGPLIL